MEGDDEGGGAGDHCVVCGEEPVEAEYRVGGSRYGVVCVGCAGSRGGGEGRSGRINVDFDNTLTDGDVRYWEGEVPEPDAAVAEAVRQRYYRGWTVVVWTARPWSEAASIAARLTEWGVPYHGLRCEKGSADLYVDDKAVRPAELVEEEQHGGSA